MRIGVRSLRSPSASSSAGSLICVIKPTNTKENQMNTHANRKTSRKRRPDCATKRPEAAPETGKTMRQRLAEIALSSTISAILREVVERLI